MNSQMDRINLFVSEICNICLVAELHCFNLVVLAYIEVDDIFYIEFGLFVRHSYIKT